MLKKYLLVFFLSLGYYGLPQSGSWASWLLERETQKRQGRHRATSSWSGKAWPALVNGHRQGTVLRAAFTVYRYGKLRRNIEDQ